MSIFMNRADKEDTDHKQDCMTESHEPSSRFLAFFSFFHLFDLSISRIEIYATHVTYAPRCFSHQKASSAGHSGPLKQQLT